ncbi:hypothetical protein ABZP36_030690 [Zizania latifolia]
MGYILLKRKDERESEISFCAVCLGVTKSLEAALEESLCYSERIETARATIDHIKVEGLDANIAFMQLIYWLKLLNATHFRSWLHWKFYFQIFEREGNLLSIDSKGKKIFGLCKILRVNAGCETISL